MERERERERERGNISFISYMCAVHSILCTKYLLSSMTKFMEVPLTPFDAFSFFMDAPLGFL